MTGPNQKIEQTNPEVKDAVVVDPDLGNADLGVGKIRFDVDLLKKDVEALNTKRADFEKEKNTLAKEVLDQKKLDIENEEKRLEAKKQELLELIKQTKSDLAALKGNVGIPTEAAQLDGLQQEITNIQIKEVPKKGWFKRQVDGLTDPTEENHILKNTARIAGGVAAAVLIYKGIKALFGRGKKDKEEKKEGEKKEEPGFWKTKFGKVLKYTGIGTGIYYITHGIITSRWGLSDFFNWRAADPEGGNNTEVSGLLRDTKNGVESFDAIEKSETKEALNQVGGDVNKFYDYVYTFDGKTIPAGLESERLGAGKDKYAGVIPHVLDNSFDNIGALDSETGLFQVGAYGDEAEIGKQFAGYLAKGISTGTGWLVNSTLGMLGCNITEKTEAAMAEKIKTFLYGENNLEEIHLLYRKMFKTMAYLNYVENTYLGQRIEKLLQGGATLYEKSGEDRDVCEYDNDPKSIKKLVKKVADNPTDFKIGDVEVETMRVADFRSKKIRDIAALGFTTETIIQYSPNVKENLDDLNKARKEKLDLLDKNPGEALKEMVSKARSEMGGSFFKGLTKVIPSAHLLEIIGVGSEQEAKDKIMDHGGFKELLDQYMQEFEKMKAAPNKAQIKEKIDKYYAQLKELTISTAGIYESKDENGNTLMHVGFSVVNAFTGLATAAWTGITMTVSGGNDVIHGRVDKGLIKIGGGLVLLSQGVGFWMLFTKYRKLGLKLTFWPIGLPTSLIRKATAPYVKVGTAEVMNPWIMEKLFRLYQTPDSILKGLQRGMSSETAFNLFKMQSKTTAGIETRFMEEVLLLQHQGADKEGFEMMQTLLRNKKYGVIDQMMLKEGWIITGTKKLSMQPAINAMLPIYNKILKGGTKNVQEVGYKMLEKMPIKEWGKVEKLLSDPEIIKEINNIKNVKSIPGVVKLLAKHMRTVANVDAAQISVCIDIIKNKGINAAGKSVDKLLGESLAIEEYLAHNRFVSGLNGINGGIPEGFEAGGKFEKYGEFRKEYEAALQIADEPSRVAKLKEVDKKFAEQLVKDGKTLDVLSHLSPEGKQLLGKVRNEIKAIEGQMKGDKFRANLREKQKIALERFSGKIESFSEGEAKAITEMTDKISIRNLATLVEKFDKPREILPFLEEISKGSEKITKIMLKDALSAKGGKNIVEILEKDDKFSKSLLEEVERIRLGKLLDNKALPEGITKCIEVLEKLLPKVIK